MPASVLIFCASPLAGRPISQRVAVFGAWLQAQGWQVRLAAVDPDFGGEPVATVDDISGMPIEIIGPTHYRRDAAGERRTTSPLTHLRECRAITQELRARIDRDRPDHVVLSTTLPASLYAAVSLRRHHPSVWLDADDWTAGQFLASGGGRAQGMGYEAIERTLPRLVGMTVCSQELLGIFPRASLVPNFLRLAEVPARPAPAGSGSGRTRVAFAASVTGFYGHEQMIDALGRRRADLTDVEVVMMGDGPGLEACRRQVDALQLGDIVTFTGHLPRPAVLAALAAADVSLVPLADTRIDRARFPLKLLDGLATGCAVVASDVGTARDVITDGVSGLLSPPGDADGMVKDVLRLAGDRTLTEALANEGRRVVRAYDVDEVCARWAAVITGSGAA